MATNVEVKKSGTENTSGLIRRFSRKMQSTGIIQTVKGSRYYQRPLSKRAKKERALKNLERRERYEELVKLGKVQPRTSRRGNR